MKSRTDDFIFVLFFSISVELVNSGGPSSYLFLQPLRREGVVVETW